VTAVTNNLLRGILSSSPRNKCKFSLM